MRRGIRYAESRVRDKIYGEAKREHDYFVLILVNERRVRARVYYRHHTSTHSSSCRGGGTCHLANVLLATSSAHAHGRLEGVVNPPLEASQSTNHDNTGTETLGGKSSHTGLGCDGANRLALVLGLAQQRDQRVSGVGNDGADDTSEVTGTEGDSKLGRFAVGVLRCSEDVSVEELHDLLEEIELCHGIWNLRRKNPKSVNGQR